MGCQSSKAASRPVTTPAGTLLTSGDDGEKSPKAIQKATAMTELATEAEAQPEGVDAIAPTAEHLQASAAEAQPEAVEAVAPAAEHLQATEGEAEPEPVEAISPAAEHPQLSNEEGSPGGKAVDAVAINLEEVKPVQEGATQATVMDPVHIDDAASPQAESNEKLQSTMEPTSRVHKNPKGWEEEGILFPHEGIRFLMQELSDAVNSMDPLPAWKWENLSTWYQDYFYTVVHHHHDAEEKIYFPWIQARASVPAKIAADHPDLMRAMDDLSVMLKKGASAPAAERAEHLADIQQVVSAFVEDMQEHLAEEEEIIPRLLREGNFTQEEEGAVVKQIIESLGLDGNKKALPPMLHAYARWAGAEKAEAFVSSNLPLPIQFLYRNFWAHDFQHRHMGLLASLVEGVDTNPFASKWFC